VGAVRHPQLAEERAVVPDRRPVRRRNQPVQAVPAAVAPDGRAGRVVVRR
jgi:hypothetical protein